MLTTSGEKVQLGAYLSLTAPFNACWENQNNNRQNIAGVGWSQPKN